ncbi:response regulator [Nocardia sp. NPDC087230]|uniref:response regulator n=1 Tax=Nocardia sp. NPDC087230 TaxID=3364331 RepID=UPI003813A1B7
MQDHKLVLVVVDDHDLFSQGLALLLKAKAADLFVIGGTTKHAEEAATLVASCGADLALVDLAMPPIGGIPAIRQIKSRFPATKVVALSGTSDLQLAEDALRAGADGFLPKSADPDVLVAPLLSVAAGLRVVEATLFTSLLDAVRHPPEEVFGRLAADEIRLWVLLSRGLETVEIAERMLVSERTAKRLIASLLNKLGAPNRIVAAGMAGHYGLLGEQLPSLN